MLLSGGGRGNGSGDAIFVHVWNGGVILGEQGEDEGRRTSRKVVDMAEAERADDGDEEERWEESGVEECG